MPTGFDRFVLANADGTLSQASFTAVIASLPSSNAWALTGNTGTTSNFFLGTTDGQPLSIRTRGIERLRIGEDGAVSVASLGGTVSNTLLGNRIVVADANGVLSQVKPSALFSSLTDPVTFGGAVTVTGPLTASGGITNHRLPIERKAEA